MGGPCNCSNARVHCDAHAWPVLAAALDKFFGLVAVCAFHLLLRVVSWGLYLRRLLLGVVCQGLFARWGCASDPRRKAGAFCGCSRVSATRPGARALRGLSVSCAPPLPPTTLAAARRGGVGHCAWSAGRLGRGRPTASSLHWRDGQHQHTGTADREAFNVALLLGASSYVGALPPNKHFVERTYRRALWAP